MKDYEKNDSYTFSLENFKGPLTILLHLIKKEELNISEVRVLEIINQYLTFHNKTNIEKGGEFLSLASILLYLKTKALLTNDLSLQNVLEDEDTPPLAQIEQLLDYFRFKKIAKQLNHCENEQNLLFPRGSRESTEKERPLGLDNIALDDMANILQDLIEKAPQKNDKLIEKEEWKVSIK